MTKRNLIFAIVSMIVVNALAISGAIGDVCTYIYEENMQLAGTMSMFFNVVTVFWTAVCALYIFKYIATRPKEKAETMTESKAMLVLCATSSFFFAFLILSGYLMELCMKIFNDTPVDSKIGFIVIGVILFAWIIFCTVYIVRYEWKRIHPR